MNGPWDEALPCPQTGCKNPLGLGMTQGIGDWRQEEEWSHPVLSGKRVGAMCAMPFGLWLKGWVWAILCSSQRVFCKGKSSLATAIYSSAPVQYLQPIAATDIYCSKGRWRRGLGSARSTTHCMRERKSLLIMSVGHQCVPWAYATSYTSRVSS